MYTFYIYNKAIMLLYIMISVLKTSVQIPYHM